MSEKLFMSLFGDDLLSLSRISQQLEDIKAPTVQSEDAKDELTGLYEGLDGSVGVVGRDLVPFFRDDKSGTEIFEERKMDGLGRKNAPREFETRQGMMKFITVVDTNSTLALGKGVTLSFERNDQNFLCLDPNILLNLSGYIIPHALFPEVRSIDPQAMFAATEAHIQYTDEKKYANLDLRKKKDMVEFRSIVGGDLQDIDYVKMVTDFWSNGIQAYNFSLKNSSSIYDRSDFRIEMPITYKWTKEIVDFAVENHRETQMHPSIQQGMNTQALADALNFISAKTISKHFKD